MISQPKMFVCVLSSGSTWSMPSILPEVGDVWPTGGSAGAYAIFTDTAGNVLASIAGAISSKAVDFVGIPHSQVDSVPAGANCEIFVTDASGLPYKIRYGRVVRREVIYPNALNQGSIPAVSASYGDTLQRTALGGSWIPILGTTQMFSNGPDVPTFDAVGAGGLAPSTSPLTYTHVISSSATALLVGVSVVSIPGSTVSITVKAGTTTLKELTGIQFGSASGYGRCIYVFGLINPPTGSQTITVTFHGCEDASANSCSYVGVTGFGTPVRADGASHPSQSIDVDGGLALFQMFGASSTDTFSGYSQTSRWNQPGSVGNNLATLIGDAAVSTPGTAAFTATQTATDDWGSIIVPMLGLSLTYGAGSPNVLTGASNSAIRWLQPLNTDTVSMTVDMMNMGQGLTGAVFCADVNFTVGLVAQFDSINNQIHTMVLNGDPTTLIDEADVSNTVAALPDTYTITYNNDSGEMDIYKGASTTPLLSWIDSAQVVPHGPGHRYVGMNWLNANLTNGIQLCGWSAKDGF